MQIINFIPEDYVQRKLARRANLLGAMLAAAVVLALAMVIVLLGLAEDRVTAAKNDLEAKVASAGENAQKWNKLQADRQALLERAEQAAKLLDPLPRSRIVAEVVQALPEKITLTEFSVDEQPVRRIEAAKPTDGTTTARARRGAANGPGQAVEKETTETRLRILGLAPTDVEVAKLIAALANSKYFSQVELSFSEDSVVNEHALRRFEVLFRLSDNGCRLGLESCKKEGQS
jgi:Tfp pilus assembly protein PilN